MILHTNRTLSAELITLYSSCAWCHKTMHVMALKAHSAVLVTVCRDIYLCRHCSRVVYTGVKLWNLLWSLIEFCGNASYNNMPTIFLLSKFKSCGQNYKFSLNLMQATIKQTHWSGASLLKNSLGTSCIIIA